MLHDQLFISNCQVGLMRDGRLLAQSSPENLMRAYSTTVSILILQYMILLIISCATLHVHNVCACEYPIGVVVSLRLTMLQSTQLY